MLTFTDTKKAKRSYTEVTRMNNILVAYDGGGYDGCIWERNFFFFFNGSFDNDPDNNKFENIYASGYRGIKTAEEAIKLLMDNDPDYDITIYDFKTEEGIEAFQSHEPVPWVVDIVNKFADWREGGETSRNRTLHKPWFKCTKTDKKCYGGSEENYEDRGYAVDWHGCGGIAQTSDTMVCGEYYHSHICGYCGEYDEDTTQGLCSYHFTQAIENINKTSLKAIYLDYDKFLNKFVETSYDFDVKDWKKEEEGERMFIVSIKSKRYVMHQEFMVMADTEDQAIEYVSLYLDGDYFTAKADSGNDYLAAFDLIDFCR